MPISAFLVVMLSLLSLPAFAYEDRLLINIITCQDRELTKQFNDTDRSDAVFANVKKLTISKNGCAILEGDRNVTVQKYYPEDGIALVTQRGVDGSYWVAKQYFANKEKLLTKVAADSKSDSVISFLDIAETIAEEFNCSESKVTQGNDYLGDLYGCVGGTAETIKIFVNEIPRTGEVENIKFIWNDWTLDKGYGVHADKQKAKEWLQQFLALYAPDTTKNVAEVFFGSSNDKIETKSRVFQYTYRQGPSVDERKLVVSEKK